MLVHLAIDHDCLKEALACGEGYVLINDRINDVCMYVMAYGLIGAQIVS